MKIRATNDVVKEGWRVDQEACRAEGLQMEAEDAGGAETFEATAGAGSGGAGAAREVHSYRSRSSPIIEEQTVE